MAKKNVGYAGYRTSHLKKITNKAKLLRKARPSLAWPEAVKLASKQIYSGKKPAAKKASKRVSGVQKTTEVIRRTKKVKVGSVRPAGHDMYKVRDYYESEIGRTIRAIEQQKVVKTPTAKRAVVIYRQHLKTLKASLRQQNALISKMLR